MNYLETVEIESVSPLLETKLKFNLSDLLAI